MSTPIVLPDLGTRQARVSLWFVQCGENLYEGDRVLEILIPGATIDISSPASGVLKERLAFPGDLVETGQVLGTIETQVTR